jgi:hypothetical protein
MANKSAQRLREIHKDVSISRNVLATDGNLDGLIASIAKWTIYIQKIIMNVSTDAAQSVTFQDNSATPVIVAKSKASPGLGPIVFDLGEEGYALGEGKQLDVKQTAGLAYTLRIEGYARPTATRSITDVL